MKKIILMSAFCAMLFACNQTDYNESATEADNKTVDINVSFGVESSSATRGFLDDVLQARPWEERISLLSIYVFNSKGDFVTSCTLTAAEINSGSAIMSIPRSATDQQCTFYAVANEAMRYVNTNNEQYFKHYGECQIGLSVFNPGTASGAISEEWYATRYVPMSGFVTAYTSPYGFFTQVHIPLTRLLAKVALEYRVDPAFPASHDGATVEITSVSLNNTYQTCYTFDTGDGRAVDGTLTSLSQISQQQGDTFRNLWYMYESVNAKFPAQINLTGIFDRDGDPATTDDRHTVTYTIPVDYITGNGTILRNHIYRISAVIKGLGDNNLAATWEIEDWNGLPVSNQDVGI